MSTTLAPEPAYRERRENGAYEASADTTPTLGYDPPPSAPPPERPARTEPQTYRERRDAGDFVVTPELLERLAAATSTLEIAELLDGVSYEPRVHVPLGSDDELYEQVQEWAPAGAGGTLDDLVDVDTTGALDGDVLAYDADLASWLPAAAGAGIAVLHVLDASPGYAIKSGFGNVNEGYFDDALGHYMEWTRTFDAGDYIVRVVTQGDAFQGIATIKIDGSAVGTIDSYRATDVASITTEVPFTVAAGNHTLRLENTGANPAAVGSYVKVKQPLEVYGA